MQSPDRLKASVTVECPIVRSARAMQLEGMFDVPPGERAAQTWTVDEPLPKDWRIGVIVGPSGSGKTTLARALFGDRVRQSFAWPKNESIVEGFPADLGIKEIVGLLSAVGFSSPPAWLKPFRVLSTGEQFRVTVARALAESEGLTCIDEFTSVVDRVVARIASAAVAKAVRKTGRRLVAVTCHYDVLDWLEPDWVYEPQSGRLERGRLRRRPPIGLEIIRVNSSAWTIFKPHHYLSGDLSPTARCWCALVEGRPAAFAAVIHQQNAAGGCWREHRTACLPDFQGVGIGNALSEFVASLFVGGKPYFSRTGHPGMIAHRRRSPLWLQVGAHGLSSAPSAKSTLKRDEAARLTASSSWNRFACTFRYVGPARPREAEKFELTPGATKTRSPGALGPIQAAMAGHPTKSKTRSQGAG